MMRLQSLVIVMDPAAAPTVDEEVPEAIELEFTPGAFQVEDIAVNTTTHRGGEGGGNCSKGKSRGKGKSGYAKGKGRGKGNGKGKNQVNRGTFKGPEFEELCLAYKNDDARLLFAYAFIQKGALNSREYIVQTRNQVVAVHVHCGNNPTTGDYSDIQRAQLGKDPLLRPYLVCGV